ncbi:MAG: UbiA family prenyltransferase [Planctomycetaceae bacterium]
MASVHDWVRLLRLPNHATAAADVVAGWLVVAGIRDLEPLPPAVALALTASVALYAAGMVLNDVFDVATDRRERPERPLPAGRIAVGTAALVGHTLLAAGVALGVAAALVAGRAATAVVAALLAGAVWLYDRHAKATSWGPTVMGSCRSLNWLLGMTVAGGPTAAWQCLIPAGMGLYVGGITLFARDEAARSRRATLAAGAIAIAAGLALVAWQSSLMIAAGQGAPLVAMRPAANWLLVWLTFITLLSSRNLLAILDPSGPRVRHAVGNCIMAIITVDAIVVMGRCGEAWGIAVLLLLVPFMIGRSLVAPT